MRSLANRRQLSIYANETELAVDGLRRLGAQSCGFSFLRRFVHLSSARTPLRELLQPSSLSDEGSLEDLQGHRQPAALMREGGVLDAATAPLPKGVLLAIKSLDEEQDAAARGVAVALLILLEDYTKPGWLPAAIDEQCTPLNGLMAPIPSFCFTEKCNGFVPIHVVRRFPNLAPNLAISAHRPYLVDTKPCILLEPRQMHQFVSFLVERFCMTAGELVLAYAIVERVLVCHPTTMRASSIRPMLLGASIIACKTCRDETLSLRKVRFFLLHISLPLRLHLPAMRLNPLSPARWQFYDVLRTVLDINVALLACIEHQMLELLYWRVPVATAQHQTYADAIFNAARDSPLSTGRRVATSEATPAS